MHSLHSQRAAIGHQCLAVIHENEQAMDTTAHPPEDKDEALSQEVYEIPKRRYPSTSAKCKADETFNKTHFTSFFDSSTREQPRCF